MDTLNTTQARQEFFNLVKGVTEGHKAFRIQHPSGSVILLSEADYEGLLETLELLSVSGFQESIKRSVEQMAKGETYSMEEVFGDDE